MMDFIYELYKNDNFTLYLTIALFVLIILFVIVLIFGKRDQKLEETKRLQKIELETFKEEPKEPVKMEVPQVKEEAIPNPVIEPVHEEVKEVKSFFDDTQVLPSVSAIEAETKEDVNVTTFEPVSPVLNVQEENVSNTKEDQDSKPLFSLVDDAAISIDEVSEMKFDEKAIEKDLNELENIKNEFNSIELPEVNDSKEEVKPAYKPSQVFSSVFVDAKEDLVVDNNIKKDENDAINVEKTNNAEVAEPTIKEEKVSLFTITEDDDTMELPSLKNEDKETKKEEKPFSFDDLNGETYNLK